MARIRLKEKQVFKINIILSKLGIIKAIPTTIPNTPIIPILRFKKTKNESKKLNFSFKNLAYDKIEPKQKIQW